MKKYCGNLFISRNPDWKKHDTRWHTSFENKLGGTPKFKKEAKMMKVQLFMLFMLFMLFVFSLMTFKDLAAHLEKFGGTLVRHGTPFEKHSNRQMICSNTCNMKEIKKGIRNGKGE